MREIRRRTRAVGAFRDGQSCLNLAAARLRYIAATAWASKCCMNSGALSTANRATIGPQTRTARRRYGIWYRQVLPLADQHRCHAAHPCLG
jgi:hypothetical protein